VEEIKEGTRWICKLLRQDYIVLIPEEMQIICGLKLAVANDAKTAKMARKSAAIVNMEAI
jgi:hypothetical protein